MAEELCGIISCILNELSSKDLGDKSNARKRKTREFIKASSESLSRNANPILQNLFTIVIDLANSGGSNDTQLIRVFSLLAAFVTRNELISRIDEFEDFEKGHGQSFGDFERGFVEPRKKAGAANIDFERNFKSESDESIIQEFPKSLKPQKYVQPPQRQQAESWQNYSPKGDMKEYNYDIPKLDVTQSDVIGPYKSNRPQLVDEPTGTVQCWKITVNGCPEDLRQYVEAHNQFLFFLKGEWPKCIGRELEGYPRPELPIPGLDSILGFELENNNLVLYESASKYGTCKVQIHETIITNFEKILMGVSIFEFQIGTDDELIIKVTTPNFPNSELSIEPTEAAQLIGRSHKNRLCFHYDQKMSKVHASISFKNDKWILQDRGSRNKTWKFLHTSETLGKRKNSRKVMLDLSSDSNPCQFSYNEIYFYCEKTHTH
ncbi:unnamed protein product [Blepharisma stoltei]|uniref:FHA domain-containing protein n=1 Tax=Blepharisma stoltei TaxID=1481888 RepID=A0AAU9IVT1_9CILI|nr:unnamed protein product [Blepharisma stoltei]